MDDTLKKRPFLVGLRVTLVAAGGLMIILAVAADKLGLGSSGSIGTGQILLSVAGFMAALTGALGGKFIKFYRVAAILLLNTIMLLVLVELGAILVGRVLFRTQQSEIQNQAYYADQEWADVYWQEALQSLDFRYRPYRIWEKRPFEGETVNFDSEGIRETPGSECVSGAFKVFTFGGSTMVGWGAPDWGTIPAHLQLGLNEVIEGPVCVVNLGEDGYVSTQSLITLILQLQGGDRPDAVLFYDGINDVLAAYESHQPGAHVTLSKIAAIFEKRDNPLLALAEGTRTFALMSNLSERLRRDQVETYQALRTTGETPSEEGSLAHAVSKAYLATYQMVGALSQEFGFSYSFYLQPHPAVAKKHLTVEESRLVSKMDLRLSELARATYLDIAAAAPELKNLFYIADIFDTETDQVWIDDVGHVTPEGNRIIAARMLEVFEDYPRE
jgi:hypothetical protein